MNIEKIPPGKLESRASIEASQGSAAAGPSVMDMRSNGCAPLITLHFTNANGTTNSVQAEVGVSLMRVATENGIPGILAECGGSGTCATCHVYVQEDWAMKLPKLTEDEEDMLDFAWERKDISRLSCQLVLDETMDGLAINVPSRQA